MRKLLLLLVSLFAVLQLTAQTRRPVDSQHPMWLIHVDVWNKADPQKIINLIPEEIKPYVVMNLSLSCGYDTARAVYKMPQNAIKTYKSWGTICQQNGMWFTCQPASGGHSHLMDDDYETFEYMFKRFPNFLGWNYAEQFWGFNEAGDKSSTSDVTRVALFARLVEMSHRYGGMLIVSFCGNIWSHHLNPVGMMKRDSDLYKACQQYPDAILWLYKYTTSSCFYNNESVTWSPFVAGLAKSYGVRYDNCGWNGAIEDLVGKNSNCKYPNAAGFGTVMEQTCVNGGAVWDGPELIWTEDFQNLSNTVVSNYYRRNWGLFPGFRNGWLDMFSKIVDGTMYIPTREEVVEKTKVYVINNVTTGSDEDKYAAWGDLYDGLYKQSDPFNKGDGRWMNNYCYFKKTGRYGAIPVGLAPQDSIAKAIPSKVNKSTRNSRWSSQAAKTQELNKLYPLVSKGDLYVNRFRNQLVTYTPYTYLNTKKRAQAQLPLLYNTCDSLRLDWGKLSTAILHEYADSITLYLNNYRSDTTEMQLDKITVVGATSEPTFTATKRTSQATLSTESSWDATTGLFTLSISHCGGVDVTVHASGAGLDRATDVVPNTRLELPKQPEPYRGPITVEAEDMDFVGIKSCVTDPYGQYPNVFGHAGNGFMDMGTNKEGSLRHVLRLAEAGRYLIKVRYTNNTKEGKIYLNTSATRKYLTLAKTDLNEWAYVSMEVSMKAGSNTLVITNTGGTACYIDNVTYQPADQPDERYAVNIRESEFGTVVAPDSVAEGERVTLEVKPAAGYRHTGWRVIHGGVTPDAEGSFVMPDDNVTLEPQFEDMTQVYALDFTSVLAGTIPPGWRCLQENDEEHAYPNQFSAGARTFSGFTGYQGKALYWREQCCEYGRQANYRLHLEPGDYELLYTMAAWKNSPKYEVKILTLDGGRSLASSGSVLALPNANGSTSALLMSAVYHMLPFSVAKEGDYVISMTNSDVVAGYDEFLLIECRVKLIPAVESLDALAADAASHPAVYYDLMGRRVAQPKAGVLYIKK